jgi:tetratricopeptide (TPR) repeat protein
MIPRLRAITPRSIAALRLMMVLSLGSAGSLFAPAARGDQAADLARAREQFEQGLSLEGAGNWAEALAKFREVATVRSTAAVRFHIARCLEELGHWNEALGAYELAVAEAEGPTKDEVVQLSEEASLRLRRQIPTLELVHAPGAEAVRVKLDGVEIGAAAFRTPLPLDPGGHELELRDGDRVARHLLKLEPRQKRSFRVERLVAPSAPLSGGRERGTTPRTGKSIGPWLVMGGGAASLAAAGVFWGLAEGKKGELEAACFTSDRCPRSAQPIHSDGERYTLLTNVTGAIGLAALATGASWWLLQPSEKVPARALPSGVAFTVDPTGAAVSGRF